MPSLAACQYNEIASIILLSGIFLVSIPIIFLSILIYLSVCLSFYVSEYLPNLPYFMTYVPEFTQINVLVENRSS